MNFTKRNIFYALAFYLPLFALLEDFIFQGVWAIQQDGYGWMADKFGVLGEFLSIDVWGWPLGYPLGIGWILLLLLWHKRAKLWLGG